MIEAREYSFPVASNTRSDAKNSRNEMLLSKTTSNMSGTQRTQQLTLMFSLFTIDLFRENASPVYPSSEKTKLMR